jgi:hypothetical protein
MFLAISIGQSSGDRPVTCASARAATAGVRPSLMISAVTTDHRCVYAKFASTFLAAKDAALRTVLAHQMQQMERNYPDLKKLPVPR